MSLSSQRICKGTPEYERTKTLYNAEFPDSTVEMDFDRFMDLLEEISADVYTYTYEGGYAGYSISIPGKSHVYYYMIAVNPELRSKGLGGQMAAAVRNLHPEKALTGLVEADDPSEEGRRTMERRLAFHARSGLKKTGYHLRSHSRDYLIISTAESFNPADMKDIAEMLKSGMGELAEDTEIVWVGD